MKNIKCNVGKSIIILFLGIIMMVLCISFVLYDFSDSPLLINDFIYYFFKGILLFGFFFLGFGLLIIIRNVIFYRNNIIELNDNYMIDRSSYLAIGKVYYKDIADVYINGMFLCIKLKNEQQYLENVNSFKRFLMNINKKMKCETICISDNFLDTSLTEIEKIIVQKIKNNDYIDFNNL